MLIGTSPTTSMPTLAEVNSEKSRDGQFMLLDRLALMQGQKHNLDRTKLQTCIKAQQDERVKSSVREAEGVEATPTMFVNGEKVDGVLPISEMRIVLDRALVQAGELLPAHSSSASTGSSQPASK